MAGTLEDLSDEERTKAFLQYLEYKLKFEKVPNKFKVTLSLIIITLKIFA